MGSRTVDCRKFTPNIFNKSKCSHCFRQREEHSAAALECNRASRKVSKCGYLFVAPDWDFSNPLYRTKRWQRRWFVLYDDGELTYSVDEHPETIPQAIIDMTKVLEVTSAEDVTGHVNSLAITAPDRVTFVKGTCPEEAKWWLNILAAFPKNKGRHKRNATFPGGQATTIISNQTHQTGRSRHNSYHPELHQSPVTPDAGMDSWNPPPSDENNININNENSSNTSNGQRVYIDQPVSSKSPPTRDKLYPEGKAQARIRSRNRNASSGQQQDITDSACLLIEDVRRDEKLKDIAKTITTISQNSSNNNNNNNNNRWSTPASMSDIIIGDEKPTRDDSPIVLKTVAKTVPNQNRPQSLAITSSTAPSIVSAIVKKSSANLIDIIEKGSSLPNTNKIENEVVGSSHNKEHERGDPDGGCNIDEVPVNYMMKKNSELRVTLPAEELLLNSMKGWLMKQDSRTGDWSKHWFTLRGAALFYYRDPVAEERGVLDGVLDVNSITAIAEISVPRHFGFQLKTWDNRRIVLSTISSNIRNNWINALKSAAGLNKPKPKEKEEKSVDEKPEKNKLIISNTTDDLKICEKNNKNTSNTMKSPVTPLTPKSILFSSDEEYRTASESGRRDSVDWGSPISTSPPIQISSLARTKERIRSRSNSNSRLHKRSRSSPPTSRRSTIDSVGSDEIVVIHPVKEECIIDDAEMEIRLVSAEKELNILKDEVQERESRVTNLLTTLEKTEVDLTNRINDVEKARDSLALQLADNKTQAKEYIERLTVELEENGKIVRDLEDKLARGIEENEMLYKKLRELENSSPSSICSLNRMKMKRLDSLSDLTNLNEFDPYNLDRDCLADEYSELKSRFEKAVNEIKLMKKELKDAQNQFDNLEITHASLLQDYERLKIEDESQYQMMAARIQDLTLKYSAAERQVRNLKAKLAKSTEKRRSLSLKGRDSLSLPKEFEEKVAVLETKIEAIESSKKSTQPEERSLKRCSSRLRRKSLDNSAISSEPLSVFLRLNTLEKRVESHHQQSTSASESHSSNNNNNNNHSSPKITDHLIDRLRSLEGVVIATRDRIDQSLQQLQGLRSSSHHRTRRSVSPITTTDKKDALRYVEKCLLEAGKILKDSCDNCVIGDQNVVILPENNPIKLALIQLKSQLRGKLSELLKQRRVLRERNELTARKELEFLAERIAFESVCFGKLRDSIARAENPKKFGEKQTRAEIAETSQLLTMLRLKLGGKCTVKPNGSLDILASVLARRLILTAGRTGQFKLPELTPVNSNVMDELLRQQNELNLIAMRYKNNAMENLASGLAAETLNYISANDAVQGAVQEAWRQAQETVNSELVQSEIAHIMLRNSERFEASITPSFGYTLTPQEHVSFENFSDAVQDALRKEMEFAVTQMTQKYEEYLSKMKKGQWRIHLEQERKASEGRQLLSEFADIIAHKALVDARINVLKGENCSPITSKDLLPSKENLNNNNNYFSVQSLQKYESLFAELATDLEISNPDDILAEADFNFMFKYFVNDFSTSKAEIKEISNSLIKLEKSIVNLENSVNTTNETTTTIASNEHDDLSNLQKICKKNYQLSSQVDQIIYNLKQKSCEKCAKFEQNLVEIKNLHEIQVTELQKVHESHLDAVTKDLDAKKSCIQKLEREKQQFIKDLDEQHQIVVKSECRLRDIETKLEKLRQNNDVKNDEMKDLNEQLDDERGKKKMYQKSADELTLKCERYSTEYNKLKDEYETLSEILDKERERVRKLEKHLEFLENEHQNQLEQIHENFKQQICFDGDDEERVADEETLRERYQAEIEHLRTLCEKGLAAMESSHRRIIGELEEKHRSEIQELLAEKEQALAEETQATLAALDAMRKAHQNEVQREVARFKQEFIKQFQIEGNSLAIGGPKEKELELDEVRLEILSLSEKYSFKCVEAASLEEKLKMAMQQVKQSQQIIQQLELRNKQLRAHLMSDDFELSSITSLQSSKESTPSPVDVHEDDKNSNASDIIEILNCDDDLSVDSKESELAQPRLNLVEEIRFTTEYKPVYHPSSLLTTLNLDSTKLINHNSISLNLRANRNSNDSIVVANTNNNNNNVETIEENEKFMKNGSKLLCSPPPLNGKDVEHLRKFELEI